MKKIILISLIFQIVIFSQVRFKGLNYHYFLNKQQSIPAGYEYYKTSDGKYFITSDGDTLLVRKTSQYWTYVLAGNGDSYPQYTLNLTTQGLGSVNDLPLSNLYDSAKTVVISAVPNAGYHFLCWRGSEYLNNATDTITMTSNKSFIAKFKKDTPNFRIIVSANAGDEEHAAYCKTSFIDGYESAGGTWTDSIQIQYDKTLDYSFQSADTNGVDLIIRSYTNAQSYVSTANTYYPVYLFFPAGSNTHTQVYNTSGNLPSMVLTGAGTTSNLTGYDIEFYGIDPIFGNLSSYSNAYIAGQLLYIADQLGVDLWTARYLARESRTWTAENGYGSINIANAISSYDSQIDYSQFDIYK